MRLVVVTLFPGLIEGYLSQGIVGRAAARGLFTTTLVDPRAFTEDRHRTVDDVPFGGGAGMVMKPEPLARAIDSVEPVATRVLLSPTGRPFRQADAERFARLGSVMCVCGRYEGIDRRVIDSHIDEELSIGDFVLSGGGAGGARYHRRGRSAVAGSAGQRAVRRPRDVHERPARARTLHPPCGVAWRLRPRCAVERSPC